MEAKQIKNFDELATTTNRKMALEIAEAGLKAINTREVILDSVKLENNILSIKGEQYDLAKFKTINVVGFGKASGEAAETLEEILGSKINGGAVIGLKKATCSRIECFTGTHPKPSQINVDVGKRIYELINNSSENDLIIVLVSGGGSSLLCYPESECIQGNELYDEFLKCGRTINEINTVRKHLSLFKGGGLAKIAYPATVVGIIFSDIPGNHFSDVASGPTYKDETTVADAEKVIKECSLNKFKLLETPKDDKYFEKVHNFVLVSNKTAVDAMAEKSEALGFKADIVSTELYDETEESLRKIFNKKADNTVALAAGEPKLVVKKKGGSGGRNLYMGLQAVKMNLLDDNSVLILLASDGMDNSDAAGAIVDKNTIEKITQSGLNVDDALERFDAYPTFKNSGNMIMTGPTGANVSDLMILLTKK